MILFMRDQEKFDEGRAEGSRETTFRYIQKGLISVSEGAEELGMTPSELEEAMTKARYKIPKLPAISHQSIMLAKQARLEQQKNGYANVRCPKCNGAPEITMTSKGERTIISCHCGYVKNIEINF